MESSEEVAQSKSVNDPGLITPEFRKELEQVFSDPEKMLELNKKHMKRVLGLWGVKPKFD